MLLILLCYDYCFHPSCCSCSLKIAVFTCLTVLLIPLSTHRQAPAAVAATVDPERVDGTAPTLMTVDGAGAGAAPMVAGAAPGTGTEVAPGIGTGVGPGRGSIVVSQINRVAASFLLQDAAHLDLGKSEREQ